ncbi:MAG: hypothetical protein JWR38_4780 [Mucilaginibacter sp.]|nr:hypothetical protein [Mucilaginibacter sp.]
MRRIHNAHESMGQKFLELTDSHFNDTNINFRAIDPLLIEGILLHHFTYKVQWRYIF